MDAAQPPLALSLLVLRWWQYYDPHACSRSHNILHEGLLRDALQEQGSPHEAFAGQQDRLYAAARIAQPGFEGRLSVVR